MILRAGSFPRSLQIYVLIAHFWNPDIVCVRKTIHIRIVRYYANSHLHHLHKACNTTLKYELSELHLCHLTSQGAVIHLFTSLESNTCLPMYATNMLVMACVIALMFIHHWGM